MNREEVWVNNLQHSGCVLGGRAKKKRELYILLVVVVVVVHNISPYGERSWQPHRWIAFAGIIEAQLERALFIYAFISLQDRVMYSSLSMIMENGC